MEEQSDTPRTDATQYQWTRTLDLARDLERELTAVTRERDEARALNAQWAEKAATWLATPEAAQRLQSYRDLAQQVAEAQTERDEARADLETERLRLAACGVVAMANTPKSAARVRNILPVHSSASLHSVMDAVDREMELRAEVERLRSALQEIVEDGDDEGARECARKALAATEAP